MAEVALGLGVGICGNGAHSLPDSGVAVGEVNVSIGACDIQIVKWKKQV